MLIKRVSFAKPLAKAKHMVKTVRNMFDKKQKVPFQPLTPDMLGYKHLAQTAYKPLEEAPQQLRGTGYNLDPGFSGDDTQVMVNPDTKEVVLSYRGTQLNSKKNRWKDIGSDLAIATGMEKFNPRFRKADKHFRQVQAKYGTFGYKFTTTGHSLGGQVSKYVNDQNKGKVHKNIAFSRGSSLFDAFRPKQQNTVDVSHKNDWISLGARLQGGKQHVDTRQQMSGLKAHNLQTLYA